MISLGCLNRSIARLGPQPCSRLAIEQPAVLQMLYPAVDPSKKICNGIPQNEAGLLSHCAFPDFPFFTCVSSLHGRHCNAIDLPI